MQRNATKQINLTVSAEHSVCLSFLTSWRPFFSFFLFSYLFILFFFFCCARQEATTWKHGELCTIWGAVNTTALMWESNPGRNYLNLQHDIHIGSSCHQQDLRDSSRYLHLVSFCDQNALPNHPSVSCGVNSSRPHTFQDTKKCARDKTRTTATSILGWI